MPKYQQTFDSKKSTNAQKQQHSQKPPSIHPTTIIQLSLADPKSLTSADVLQLQRTIGNRAVGQLMSEIGWVPPSNQHEPVQRQAPEEEEELMQGKFDPIQRQGELEDEEVLQGKFEVVQRQGPEEEEELLQGKFTSDCIQLQVPEEEEELMQGKFASGLTGTLQAKEEAPPNRTGMPDHLKSGIENISGMDLSGVRVHFNSSKPKQLNAFAYTQGQEIHVAPGQDKHLPHEGWHAVQQMQGRVKPTMQARGVAINDDAGLEREADVMGAKSLKASSSLLAKVVQKKDNKDTVAQLEPSGDEYSIEQQELLDLSDELQKNKSKITSVSESEVEEAISGLKQIVQSGDKSTISEVLKNIKSVAKNAETNESESGTVQLAPWTYKKKRALKGALIGTLVPVIGNIIFAIIGYKTGKKKDLNQLYADGATPAEVTAMMAIEPNTQIIHTQIQAEAAQSATLIHQLYTDGATSAQITAMLAIEPNGHTIHNLIQPVNPNFTPDNIVFASMAGGNFGSIYFTTGRIRLTHNGNPKISVHAGITRYTINNADYAQYSQWKHAGPRHNRPLVEKYHHVMALPSCALAVIGAGDRLFEFYGVNGAQGNHPSRGGPVAFPYVLNQIQVNILYNGANMNNNQTLRNAMAIDPVLAGIPMNPI